MSDKIKAHAVYIISFLLFSLTAVIYTSGPFGESISRTWLLALALILAPISNLKELRWYFRYLLAIAVGFVYYVAQAYLVYGFHHYQPDNPVNKLWLLASIGFHITVAYMALAIASFLVFHKFRYIGFWD